MPRQTALPTLTLEDDIGGLEIRVPDGKSIAVEPEPGTLLVHVGEILAFATRGRFCATPHRVINRLSDRSRVSIPIFLNPSLQTIVTHSPSFRMATHADVRTIHTFIASFHSQPGGPFLFGAAEWNRKGLNVWSMSV